MKAAWASGSSRAARGSMVPVVPVVVAAQLELEGEVEGGHEGEEVAADARLRLLLLAAAGPGLSSGWWSREGAPSRGRTPAAAAAGRHTSRKCSAMSHTCSSAQSMAGRCRQAEGRYRSLNGKHRAVSGPLASSGCVGCRHRRVGGPNRVQRRCCVMRGRQALFQMHGYVPLRCFAR